MKAVGPYCTNCGYLIGEGCCKCEQHDGGMRCTWCGWVSCICPRGNFEAHRKQYMSQHYDADYFLRGVETGKSLYKDYRWLPNLTIPMACAIGRHLKLQYGQTILDFGCARGYLVKALRAIGYKAHGVDVSEWAINNSDEEIRSYVHLAGNMPSLLDNEFDWIIAKDVLEHVEGLAATIDMLKSVARKGIFVVVPLAHGRDYDVPEYELDVTHVHRRPLQWWVGMFHQAGWSVEARYRIQGIKDNYAQYPTGNGFITARRLA